MNILRSGHMYVRSYSGRLKIYCRIETDVVNYRNKDKLVLSGVMLLHCQVLLLWSCSVRHVPDDVDAATAVMMLTLGWCWRCDNLDAVMIITLWWWSCCQNSDDVMMLMMCWCYYLLWCCWCYDSALSVVLRGYGCCEDANYVMMLILWQCWWCDNVASVLCCCDDAHALIMLMLRWCWCCDGAHDDAVAVKMLIMW